MYNAMPPNLMHGIQLVQAGRRAEALHYLRYAAQVEPITVEGWLWLAAATDNLDEYRFCVAQALHHDPYHPTALRMQNALEARDTWSHPGGPPPGTNSQPVAIPRQASGPGAARRRLPWWRRVLRIAIVVLVLGGCIGGGAALIASGTLTDLVRDWTTSGAVQTLDFTVGDTPGYHFRMDVPDSWQPANTDTAAWQTTRETLADDFPAAGTLWEELDESFSVVVRDPTYGTIMPLVHVIETDPERLRAAGMVPQLTLHDILPLPDALPDAEDPDAICTRMRALETEFVASGGYATLPGGAVIDTTLEERDPPDDCVFAVERRYSDLTPDQVPAALSADAAPDATREVVIAVPVGAVRYAVWQIVYPDRLHDTYDDAVDVLIDSLTHVP